MIRRFIFILFISILTLNCGSSHQTDSRSQKDLFIKLSSLINEYNLQENDYFFEVELLEPSRISESEIPNTDQEVSELNSNHQDEIVSHTLETFNINLWNVNEQIYKANSSFINDRELIIRVTFYKGNSLYNQNPSETENEEEENDNLQGDLDVEIIDDSYDSSSLDDQLMILAQIEVEIIPEQLKNGYFIDLSSIDWTLNDFDNDGDNLPNIIELSLGTDPDNLDSDRDGVNDFNDLFPLDINESYDLDQDGIGDSSDQDKDGDGLDENQESEQGTDDLKRDTDEDGIDDNVDNCPLHKNQNQINSDDDDLGDECDPDDDNDGILDEIEIQIGTDPFLVDSDGDGVDDSDDLFPTDPEEIVDFDNDGIGNNSDPDDDNDGLEDLIERRLNSNPFSNDSDGDTIIDGIDNCLLDENKDQLNFDNDSFGDVCDDDIDGDGLSNLEENSFGQDTFITDIMNPDSDGDGVSDFDDNCPLIGNEAQEDLDSDGFGNDCDCEPLDENINPFSDDIPDIHNFDSNCDGIDGDIKSGIFISVDGVANFNDSHPLDPTSDLDQAILYASEHNKDIYFLEGEYILDNRILPPHISLFGGYHNDFTQRDLFQENHSTILKPSTNDGFFLQKEESEKTTFISGIFFKFNLFPPIGQRAISLLHIEGIGEVAPLFLENNRFSGDNQIDQEILININQIPDIRVIGNFIEGKALRNSLGLSLNSSQSLLMNNIFSMGNGLHTQGIDIFRSESQIYNNTIDGGRHEAGSSLGISYELSNLKIINNIILTENNNEQFSLSCEGDILPEELPTIHHNLFIRKNTFGLDYPVYSGCDGITLLSQNELINSNEINVNDINFVDENSDPNSLIDILNFNDEYSLSENSIALDRGVNLDQFNIDITYDRYGVMRPDDDPIDQYDLGGIERVDR